MQFTTAKQRETTEYKQALRADLLRMAGIDEQEAAKGIRLAYNRLKRHLHSRKVELVTHQGEYKRVIVPDNQAQLRAAEGILHMTGANATKQEAERGDITVNILFPSACEPDHAIDVTPQPVVLAAPSSDIIAANPQQHEDCDDSSITD